MSIEISPASPSPGAVVHFNALGVPAFVSWSFGDPESGDSNTSTALSPAHAFAREGDYVVTLGFDGGVRATKTVHVKSASAGCPQGTGFLCLNGGRFQVSANWTKLDGTSGAAFAVSLTDDSGYFYFFDPANIEMVVKVLDGCSITNAYWVFAAGLTNVQVDWEVVDLQTGVTYTQQNPQGVPFAPIQDTKAFPTSCP